MASPTKLEQVSGSQSLACAVSPGAECPLGFGFFLVGEAVCSLFLLDLLSSVLCLSSALFFACSQSLLTLLVSLPIYPSALPLLFGFYRIRFSVFTSYLVFRGWI